MFIPILRSIQNRTGISVAAGRNTTGYLWYPSGGSPTSRYRSVIAHIPGNITAFIDENLASTLYCITLYTLLLIILCLLYYQSRLKKASLKKMAAKSLMLEQILQEKEWLLKEVHHRVKNNLQTVLSLLESQASGLKDEALDAIHESQHRVYAISLIHKKLYEADHIGTVAMADYIPELVRYLDAMIPGKEHRSFRHRIDNIHLDASQAVPVGLIVNEAVTNAMKHAFPPAGASKEAKVIRIALQPVGTGYIGMTIADNGIGLPGALLQGVGGGLGLRLLFGLTKDIQGSLIISNRPGATLRFIFPLTGHPEAASGTAHL